MRFYDVTSWSYVNLDDPLVLIRRVLCYIASYGFSTSLVPRPSPAPVFDRLQYAKTEGEGLVNLTT